MGKINPPQRGGVWMFATQHNWSRVLSRQVSLLYSNCSFSLRYNYVGSRKKWLQLPDPHPLMNARLAVVPHLTSTITYVNTQPSLPYILIQQLRVPFFYELVQSFSWGILHYNHQRFLLNKIIVISNNVWMFQHCQNLHFIQGRETFLLSQVIHWNLLDNYQSFISLSPDKVHYPVIFGITGKTEWNSDNYKVITSHLPKSTSTYGP